SLHPDNWWFLLGPTSTGFSWHQDPYDTSAWNVLLAGGPKRWEFSKTSPFVNNAEALEVYQKA
ncbi:unnamed protein product, partial [Amoebophrya sp. A25]